MFIYVIMRKSNTENKERITITIEKELLDWLDENIKKKIFANRSHGFEYLIKKTIDMHQENEEK